jgi:eukaryotic-like serine/threonine-protein kinase
MVAASEGDVLAGKYRVEKLLGVGGMGMVVSAHHIQLDEKVALKFLAHDALKVPEAVARFIREARAATKIKSEHVVRIIDVGSFESGEPYMVMEYLEGSDLGALIRDSGPLPPEVAAEYLLQACEALAEAHALGIIHRDLKPSNLFLTRRRDGSPLVKVLDFGISKVASGSSSGPDLGLTKTTAMMGSPLYMSPEQMASARDVDARTDLWALGAILYELLAGVPPFNADTLPQLCAAVLQQEPEPLRARRPELPPAAETIVARCLRKSPAERYANVAELAVALAELAPQHARASAQRISRVLGAVEAPPVVAGLSPDPAPVPATTGGAWSETAPVVPKRSMLPALAAGGGLLVLVLAGIGLFVGVGRSRTKVEPPVVAASVESAPAPEIAAAQPAIAEPVASAPVPVPSASVAAIAPAATARVLAKGKPKVEVEVKPQPVAPPPPKPPSTGTGSGLGGRL